MRRRLGRIMAVLSYGMGIFLSIYVGGWMMLIQPLCLLINAISQRQCTFQLFMSCVLKIFLSATISGLVWCVGYIGFSHFKGKEEPDWEELEEEYKS